MAFDEASKTDLVLVTGICVAAKGYEREDGKFQVCDLCLPGIAVTPPRTIRNNHSTFAASNNALATGDLFVTIVSGLNYGSDSEGDIRVQNFIDFISKNALDGGRSVNAVVFCGNSLRYALAREGSGNRVSLNLILQTISL